MLKSLKVAKAEGKKWKDELDKFLLAYRTTPHSSTGATPAFLMFERELKTKLINSTGAETLEDRVVPPSVADTATTTEPKSRPS